MRIAGIYSFNRGTEDIRRYHPHLLAQVEEIIRMVDSSKHKAKKSVEKSLLSGTGQRRCVAGYHQGSAFDD